MHDFLSRLGLGAENPGAATTSGFLDTTGAVHEVRSPVDGEPIAKVRLATVEQYEHVKRIAVAAKNVRDPDRNIPRATLLGTLATAVVYVLSLVAVFGIVSNQVLQDSTAPFSTAVNEMFGGTFWGYVMALVVITSGIGALNGWTLVTAEVPRAAAQEIHPRATARDSDICAPRRPPNSCSLRRGTRPK